MDEAKKRVEEECAELQERLSKLGAFLLSDKVLRLSNEMQHLLGRQHEAMCTYLWILKQRLEIWDNPST